MTLEEYIKDEANLAKFEKCETQADVDALLAADGVVVSEVGEIGDELNESELEGVAGGVAISTILAVTAFVILNWDQIKYVAKDVATMFAKGGKKLVEWYNDNKSKFKKAGIKLIK